MYASKDTLLSSSHKHQETSNTYPMQGVIQDFIFGGGGGTHSRESGAAPQMLKGICSNYYVSVNVCTPAVD